MPNEANGPISAAVSAPFQLAALEKNWNPHTGSPPARPLGDGVLASAGGTTWRLDNTSNAKADGVSVVAASDSVGGGRWLKVP